jgi:nucleotide-binding universal stress UspA family protein
MFQRLLICTDLVDGLQRLVNFVPSLAVGGVQQIVFLHVVQLSGDQAVPQVDQAELESIRQRLASAHSTLPPGVDVQVEVQYGQPVDRILAVAATHQSDIVLLGSQSRSFLTEKLFGSTTMALCQRSKIPLMIFRPQLLSTYTVEELDLRCRHLFRYLLIPYDGSNVADYLVTRIKALAQARAAESLEQCLLCWVVETVRRRDVSALMQEEQTQKASQQLAKVKADLETLNLKVSTEVLRGEPVPAILSQAQEYDITAIVTASDSLGKILELSVPCFTGDLLRRSWFPVIYFPMVKN